MESKRCVGHHTHDCRAHEVDYGCNCPVEDTQKPREDAKTPIAEDSGGVTELSARSQQIADKDILPRNGNKNSFQPNNDSIPSVGKFIGKDFIAISGIPLSPSGQTGRRGVNLTCPCHVQAKEDRDIIQEGLEELYGSKEGDWEKEVHVCPQDESGLCDDCPCHETPPKKRLKGFICQSAGACFPFDASTPTDTTQGWEKRIDLIWERAHIPEWANDAKTAIKSFFREVLQKEREKPQNERERYVFHAGFAKGREVGYDPEFRKALRREGAHATLERVRGIVEKIELYAPANEYVEKVKHWNKTYDRAFDDGFMQAKEQILSALDTDKGK